MKISGWKLIAYMARAGINNNQLADMLYVHPSAVSLWRCERANPTEENLRGICRALMVTPKALERS